MHHLEVLKTKITKSSKEGVMIPMQGGEFMMTPVFVENYLIGVNVSNLGDYSFLPLDVFTVTITLLETRENNTARKGNVMKNNLGDDGLGIDSVEGLVAKIIYCKNIGDTVFRRITPISRILQWAGVCRSENGSLVLVN